MAPLGSIDSAQLTDLVGCYILTKIKHYFPSLFGALYRDGAFFTVQQRSKVKLCRIEKSIRHHVKECFNLSITFHVNDRAINILDVTLDLDADSYFPS